MRRKINHVNRFFKEVKRLEDLTSSFPFTDERDMDDVHVWRSLSHEADANGCFLRDDGLWETTPEWYGNQYRRKFVFLWRIKPNYCCRGKPHFNWDEKEAFLKESETEKVIQVIDGYEYCIGWNTFREPTWCVWGMGMGQIQYYLRKDGKVLTEPTAVKKYFREDVNHELEKHDAKI